MNTQTIKICFTCLALLTSAACMRAATITKANNTDNLNLTTSWTSGVVPGASDVARWDINVTSANSVALGADTSWGGIIITNPGGAVTITAGNTLTLGTSGIDMSRALQNLTIDSGLTLGPGMQRWNVTNGLTLTVNGTFSRSANATLVKGALSAATASQGTVTLSPALVNGVVPWAAVQSAGAAANGIASGNNFATVSAGNIVAYTGATPATTAGTGVVFGGIPTGDNSTVNYDLGVASTGGDLVSDLYVNTLRNIGGAYINHGTANFRANAIMNAGSGVLTIGTPIQQADTTLNEIVLAALTSGITLTNTISDNVNPVRLTITGTNSQNIIFTGQNTFSGGVILNAARAGISVNSIPTSGTLTSGPLGTGTVTLNGGILYSTVGGFTIGNPIVVGPGGGQFQMNGASPDLSINGNITGSGTLTLAGVFNQNGLFLNGDNSTFDGTVIVTGSNNRLGTGASGSALARWVVNGALQARVVGGDTYYLGELSSTATTGGLVGWAANLSPAIQEFVVGALNTSSTYSGIIVNNAAGNAQTGNTDAAANNVLALTKVGTGTLTLAGNCTYTGPTTISAGGLQLGTNGAAGALSASSVIQNDGILTINRNNALTLGSTITGSGSLIQAGSGTTTLTNAISHTGGTVVSGGTLLVNSSMLGTATVMSGATLGGNGTVSGAVTVQAGGQLRAGATAATIGTLTLNSTPVLGGSVFVKVNAGTSQSDRITVTGGNPINYGGTLVVSNTGVPLLAGDTFTIFTATTHNGNFDTIVGAPPGLGYTFANGVLTVVSTAATDPTDITTTATVIGDIDSGSITNILTFSWPPSHSGWLLQSQTNNVDGSINYLGPWFDLPGSVLVNLLNITNPPDRAVYFRMKYDATPLPANSPTILTARPTNSAVALTWTAPANARNYNVKNATTSGGPYDTVANVIATSYTNTGLANGTTYYFVVSAVNYNGETADSSETNATPIAVPPTAPTGPTAQAAHGLVQVSWTAPTGAPATSYNVKRGTLSGGPYTTITNVTATSFIDTNVVDGVTYFYVVSGLNIDGEGVNSTQVSATPTATPPAVPTGLTATGQYTQVRLNWTASFGVTSYNVKRATSSGGPYTTFTNTTATTVYNTGLVNGTPYYFVVSALNDIGESTDSSEATATPSSVLPLVYDFENTGAGYPAPPLPPLGDPSLPYIQSLPDPFTWGNDPLNIGGTRSTNFSDWSRHRAEIKAQIENYEIGYKPTVDPSMIFASISGSGTTRTLTVRVTNIVSGTPRTLTLTSAITLPAASGTFPAIIGMNSANGSISLGGRAIATINFQHNQVTTYGNQQVTDPYYQLYAAPYSPALDNFNTGQYSAWSWGVSRLLDGLHKLNGNLGGGVQLNLGRIGVTGCSYAGKMALFCGAFDERIALTIPQESGGGGAPNWRYSGTEPAGTVEWLPNTDHNWFRESMFAFGNGTNVSFLPEDHHELMAMVAPRALFATGNPDGAVWLSNPSCYVSCRAAERVYETFGVSDRLGWNIEGGKAHCARTASLDADVYAFLDKFLLGSNSVDTISARHVPASYSSINYARWTAWWGTTNAVLPP